MNDAACQISGVGLGLRHGHLLEVLRHTPRVPWLELLVDNWLAPGGLNRKALGALAEHYPLTLHGVSLNLGGMDPLDWDYLFAIKQLKQNCQAVHYSEHACFSQHKNQRFHDLCPLPYTQEAASHLARRILCVQDYLGEQILIENVSSYLNYEHSTLTEAEFLNEVASQADCLLLLDLNNIYVNEFNHGVDAKEHINTVNPYRVAEIHIAGHEPQEGYLLDTHNSPVSDGVWALCAAAVKRFKQVPVLLEWDHDLPPWAELEKERQKAELLWQSH